MQNPENDMREMTLKEIHDSELAILGEIDAICSKIGIKYFALYGTLIGCIRHQGFIPWDDDLDIGMFRNDYDIFCTYMQTHKHDGIYLDNPLNNKRYPFYISRVCEKKHRIVFDDFTYKSGVFIDIYPIDPMGNESDLSWWTREVRKQTLLRKGLVLSNSKILYGKNIFNKIMNIPFSIAAKFLKNSYFYKRLDRYKERFSMDESSLVGVPCWTSSLRECRYDKQIFSSAIRFPFENTMISVPIGYDLLLKQTYGDYMKLPDEDKRIPGHNYSAYF